MKINTISPINFQAGVNIACRDNIGHKYLYNEIQGLTNQFKIPATFKSQNIELPSVTNVILAKLNELGMIHLSVDRLCHTVWGRFEFVVILRKKSKR